MESRYSDKTMAREQRLGQEEQRRTSDSARKHATGQSRSTLAIQTRMVTDVLLLRKRLQKRRVVTPSTLEVADGTIKAKQLATKLSRTRLKAKVALTRTQKHPSKSEEFSPLARFKQAAKLVIAVLRVTYSASQRREAEHSEAKLLSFAQLQSDLFEKAKHDLAFDLSLFKANRKMQLSTEAINILKKTPSQRSDNELHTALVALNQVVDAFGEFPINMQESLVRVGWYEKFSSKRVIIRQGHKADNFYFILSGVAVVTILENDDKTGEPLVRTAAFLKKGNSFGELALMHGALRSATVTCQDDVELLAVGREDFIDIFMPITKDTEPEHIQFLRYVDILDYWPLECLPYDDPKICLFTYFRRGVVMCKDSNKSEWIYVVKTGTCRILKSLKVTRYAIANNSSNTYLPNLKSNGVKSQRGKSKSTSNLHLVTTQPRRHCRSNTVPAKVVQQTECQQNTSTCLPPIKMKKQKSSSLTEEEHLKTIEAIYTRLHEQGTSGMEVKDERDHKPTPTETVFVQVQKLNTKDTFGLVNVAFAMTGNSTSVSLVSDGAECILINKKFFLHHLTETMIKHLRKTIQPYPSEESLEQKLQEKADWDAFKVRTVKEFVHSSRLHDTLYY